MPSPVDGAMLFQYESNNYSRDRMQTSTTKTCYGTENGVRSQKSNQPCTTKYCFCESLVKPRNFLIVFGAESYRIESLETDCRLLNKQVHVKRNTVVVQICSIYHQKVTANPLNTVLL